MNESHPTHVLREEHQRILQVASALEEAVGRDGPGRGAAVAGAAAANTAVAGGTDAALDYDRIGKCIRFIRLFADACHHGKEEDLLFPVLIDGGLPADGGPIAVMLHEHRIGRALARTMAESIDAAREGDADAGARLTRAAVDYVALIRNHILKEDDVLFEIADSMVRGPACARLCAACDGTAEHTFGGCSKRELEALGREIVDGA